MSPKTIVGALVILAALAGITVFLQPKSSTVSRELSAGFTKFKAADLSSVEKIAIKKGGKNAGALELRKEGDGWVIPTAWDYPADKKKVQELIDELKKAAEAKNVEKRGSQKASHSDFKVDDEKGVRLLLQGKAGAELASLVLGGDTQSRGTFDTKSCIRFGDEDTVWEVPASLRNKVVAYPEKIEAKTFIDKVLYKLPEGNEAVRVTLVRADHNVILEKRTVEVPVEAKKDEKQADEAAPGEGKIDEAKDDKKEAKKPETKKEDEYWVTSGTASFKTDKSKEWEAKGMFTRDLRCEDAAERKDPKEYGLDQPQLKVELVHRKKDQKDAPEEKVVFLFGNAIKEDKEGADKGENKAYYCMIEGPAGGGRIYTVGNWDFKSWNKELKDFEKAPEPKPAEAKPAEAQPAEGKAAPTPPPAVPTPSPAPAPAPPAPPAPVTPSPAAPAPAAKVTVSHILFQWKGAQGAPATATRSKEEAKKEADAALAELKKDAAKFAETAKQKSDSPSKASGGDLGELGRGVMAKAFEEAAFVLKPGELSGVVETEAGYQIILRTK